ncbi:DUF6471 domain-containing protein [Brevundimonas sp. 'scallop']|uniref:DUF6471 domain-containing protein n=1 Tax=Brevundimonas sp. 'scallop' TaxID=2562582 RepID=UPI0013E11A81|nr:DUF6471 domain-containing protein [Brevundimonas sp. 'scallop']QIF80358.1 hypothetical protein E4341_00915 [Brevundimonas sp. 'scallop']
MSDYAVTMPVQTLTPSNAPLTDAQWRDIAKGMLKAELKRQNLTYADLSNRLASLGVDESEASIRNKISRGSFSFVFALQATKAIGLDLIAYRPDISYVVQPTSGFYPAKQKP